MQVFLGLGSNLGDREANLVNAKDLLMKRDVLVLGQSKIRETEPLGGKNQAKYLNQVIECSTELEPFELLRVCKTVEKEMGRPVEIPVGNVSFVIKGKKWESRIIDIDILLYGKEKIQTAILTIPHYDCANRQFVIDGIRDIDAQAIWFNMAA